jgi:hypothetical protein
MNRANPLPPASKSANSKIERVRSASVKKKVAVGKADDKTGCLNQQAVGGNSRRFFYVQTSG